jgi:hypothetical protein
MKYETFELFEMGNAGSTILEKGSTEFDELMEPSGESAEALEE